MPMEGQLMPNVLSISGVIGFDVQPKDIRSELNKFSGDIVVELGSPGGFVYDGLEIFNLIRAYDKGTVTTKIMGLAASMASYIALAGDKVIAYDNSVFMIHNAMSVSVGDQNEMRETANLLESLSNLLAKKYSEKSGLSLEKIKSLMDQETYLFGDEIKEKGFVDEIITNEKDSKNRESAIIESRVIVDHCFKTMKELEHSKEDLNKVAACINFKDNKSVNLNEIKQENKMPTLKEFISQNPEAKIDFENSVNQARLEGEQKIKNRIEAAKNYIANENYPTVTNVALDVILGKSDPAVLTATIAAIDAVLEKKNSELAQKETEILPETQSEEGEIINETGICQDEYQFQNEIKRFKNMQGVK